MNLYEILGVNHNSTQDNIKKAYKDLARKYHPDKNKDDNATDKFKDINMAYEILGNDMKRQEYDTMSQVEQYEFYDILKSTISKINPDKTRIIENVVNFFYEDESTLKTELNNFNFTNIFSRIHTKLENSTLADLSKFIKSIDDNHSKGEIIEQTQETALSNLNLDVNPNIKLNISATLKDRFFNKYKKVTYKTNKENDVVYVPLYGNEIIFPNKGNYYEHGERGNVYVTINTSEHDTIKIINDNDLAVFIRLSLYEYLYGTDFDFNLFGDNIHINSPSCIDTVPIIKINNKGLPYNSTELDDLDESDEEYVDISKKNEIARGDFYIYFQIENINEFKSQLKDIFPPLNRND